MIMFAPIEYLKLLVLVKVLERVLLPLLHGRIAKVRSTVKSPRTRIPQRSGVSAAR